MGRPRKNSIAETPIEAQSTQEVASPRDVAPDTLTVPKDKFEKMMEMLEKQNREISQLKDIAGKAALQEWENKKKNHEVKKVHLKVVDGQVVVGWGKMVENTPPRKVAGAWIPENQIMELHLLDGTKRQIQYGDFTSFQEFREFEIRGQRTETDSGKRFLTLVDPAGVKIEIWENFVNPQ